MSNDTVDMNDFQITITGEDTDGTEGYALLSEGFAMATIDKVFLTYRGDDRKPVAELSLICEQDGQRGKVYDNLFIIPSCEWKLRQFFKALGLLHTGESFTYRWDLVGMSVPVTLAIEEYQGRDGSKKRKNTIKNYRALKEVPQRGDSNPPDVPADAMPEDDIPF